MRAVSPFFFRKLNLTKTAHDPSGTSLNVLLPELLNGILLWLYFPMYTSFPMYKRVYRAFMFWCLDFYWCLKMSVYNVKYGVAPKGKFPGPARNRATKPFLKTSNLDFLAAKKLKLDVLRKSSHQTFSRCSFWTLGAEKLKSDAYKKWNNKTVAPSPWATGIAFWPYSWQTSRYLFWHQLTPLKKFHSKIETCRKSALLPMKNEYMFTFEYYVKYGFNRWV